MLDEGELDDAAIMVDVEEVQIVREPTDTKEENDENKHLDHLLLVLLSPGQGIRIVPYDGGAPQAEAHPGVAEQHHQPWQQVGHQHEHQVVAENISINNNTALYRK